MRLFLLFVIGVRPVYELPYVDSPPRCTLFVEPSLEKDHGVVVMHILVDEEGLPESLEVWFTTDSLLNRKALEVGKKFRFQPAFLRGKEVACWTVVTIPFFKEKEKKRERGP